MLTRCLLFCSDSISEALRPIPAILESGVATKTATLQHAMAAVAIIGGFREVLRVGGKVQVFSSNNRKKRKLATLLAFDPVAGVAKVTSLLNCKAAHCLGRHRLSTMP